MWDVAVVLVAPSVVRYEIPYHEDVHRAFLMGLMFLNFQMELIV